MDKNKNNRGKLKLIYKNIQTRTLEILEQAEDNDLASKICDFFILGLVFLNIVAVVLESEGRLYEQYSYHFYIFEVLSVGLFSLEYLMRIWASGARADDAGNGAINTRLKYIFRQKSLSGTFSKGLSH